MSILSPIITFVLFVLGLLAWRLQLIDKRRFEIAEEALVTYAKMGFLLARIRGRNRYDGFAEFKAERKARWKFSTYAAKREWQYRIPPEMIEEWGVLEKQALALSIQTQIYLTQEIAQRFVLPTDYYWRVADAAVILNMISPHPSIDPENKEKPPTDYDDPEPLTNEQCQDLEREFFPVRFETRTLGENKATDTISVHISENYQALVKLCEPYTNQNPYRFLYRFAQTLKPERWWLSPVRSKGENWVSRKPYRYAQDLDPPGRL